ncbi:RNA polymerase II transcription elongation factor DSIF/SUPT5H/SPT5, partial [Trachipleistophora hominis]
VSAKQQVSLLPSTSSPKLWLVRVKPGKERQVLFKIISERHDNIYSVIIKDGLPGYVYLESFHKQSVLNAIDTCKFVGGRVNVVPLDEMVEVMTYRKNEIVLFSYVRMKKGRYKDDVGMIVEKISDEMVRVRLVPRIDGVRRLFVPEEHDNVIRVSRGFVMNKEFYDEKGFLERNVKVSDLRLGESPSINELRDFKSREYEVGECVTVKKGELRTLSGRIKTKRENELVIQTDTRTYTVSERDVQKDVRLGDEVGVKNEGTGVVVHVQGQSAIVALDNFSRELCVPVDELTRPQEVYTVKKNTNIRRARRDPLVNKKVTVIRGSYKGFDGVVKDVHRDNVLVQLVSNLKRVEVRKSEVMLVEDGWRGGLGAVNVGTRTPGQAAFGGRTSDLSGAADVGTRTPGQIAFGGKTPDLTGAGGKTPGFELYGVQGTPRPDGNAPYKTPYRTPSRGGRSPPQTPGMGSRTPYRDQHKSPYKTPRASESVAEESASVYRGTQLLHQNKIVEVLDIIDGTVITHTSKIKLEHCQFVQPSKYDRVIVLRGNHAGCTGILVRVSDSKGTVRCAESGAINVNVEDMSRMN